MNYHVRPPPLFFADVQEQLFMHSQGMVSHGSYVYMDHLLALNSCINPYPQSVKTLSLEVYSPLNLPQWTLELESHPDKAFSSYILQGIRCGFRIGFNYDQPIHPASSNLHSSNPEVISDYLQREVSLSRMWNFLTITATLVFTAAP